MRGAGDRDVGDVERGCQQSLASYGFARTRTLWTGAFILQRRTLSLVGSLSERQVPFQLEKCAADLLHVGPRLQEQGRRRVFVLFSVLADFVVGPFLQLPTLEDGRILSGRFTDTF